MDRWVTDCKAEWCMSNSEVGAILQFWVYILPVVSLLLIVIILTRKDESHES